MKSMLDKRAQLLLKTLVERYIAEGQPVGSRTLSRYSGLDLSPATIRNVMSDLEELGFIASPHTSAGRVPTPAGYRFFVDTLLVVKQLESGDLHRIEDQIHPDNPQRVIQSASQLLSQLTRFAGVVMTPRRAVTFKHLEFLKLSEKRILLIVVAPDGDVQNRILFTERDFSPSELIEAANYINQNYSGQSFEEVRGRGFVIDGDEKVTGLTPHMHGEKAALLEYFFANFRCNERTLLYLGGEGGDETIADFLPPGNALVSPYASPQQKERLVRSGAFVPENLDDLEKYLMSK